MGAAALQVTVIKGVVLGDATVILLVAEKPPEVALIVAVPGLIELKLPDALMVATPVAEELHVPVVATEVELEYCVVNCKVLTAP
jgi:hypothetical protein